MPSHSQCSRNRSDHPSLRRRRLVAALCLTTGIALSACGPAHKGQLTVEPVNASAEASASSSATPSKKPSPTATKSPSTPSPSATAWTAPNVTISHDQAGTWLRQDDILKQPVTTSTEIGQAYDFDAGGCPAIIFYNADPSIDSERKRGGDNTISSIKVRQTMSNHTSFVVTSGPTPVEAIPDELASTDAWHQFLSSTRVAGLDAGVMG